MVTISVIVPCFNEESTIITVLEAIKSQKIDGFEFQVIVIDDGSTDQTLTLLRENEKLYHDLICMPENGGKGAAVKAGLAKATGDYVLFQDADLEYCPDDYKHMVMPIASMDSDIIMGSRMMGGHYTRVVYFWHKVGNYFITLMFNLLNNTTFSDIYSCYLMYRRDLVDYRMVKTRGWEQHAEILSIAIRGAKKMYDVPVSYDGRTYGEGKKIRGHHVFAIMKMIISAKFRR